MAMYHRGHALLAAAAAAGLYGVGLSAMTPEQAAEHDAETARRKEAKESYLRKIAEEQAINEARPKTRQQRRAEEREAAKELAKKLKKSYIKDKAEGPVSYRGDPIVTTRNERRGRR